MRGGSAAATVWLPLLVWWSVGVIVVLLLARGAAEVERGAVATDQPDAVTVGSREYDGHRPVAIRMVRDPDPRVRVDVAGTVTALSLATGHELAQGEVIASVDGVGVVLMQGALPAHRDLTVGDRGPDVRALHDLLSEMALLPDETTAERFDGTTKAAVRELQRLLGAAPRDGVFRTSYVAFAPLGSTVVSRAVAQVGERVDVGDPLLEMRGRATDVVIEPVAEGDVLTMLDGPAVVLRAGEREVPLESRVAAGHHIEAVEELIAQGLADRTLSVSPGEDPVVVGASLALAEVEVRGTVPMTSLYGGAQGAVCLFERVRPSSTGQDGALRVHALAPTPATGEVGAALVPAELVGAVVVRDPGSLGEDELRRCA